MRYSKLYLICLRTLIGEVYHSIRPVKFFLFLCALFLTSCLSPYMVDLNEDLPKGYFYSGNKLPYIDDGNFFKKNDIWPIVVKYKYNDHYIVAKQKPRFEAYLNELSQEMESSDPKNKATNDKSNSNFYRAKADSILKNDPKYRYLVKDIHFYWIIDLDTESLYGPFEKYQFELQFKKLGLPRKLKL